MKKMLTCTFMDIENASDVTTRSVADNKENMVLMLEGVAVVVSISNLKEAIKEIEDFNNEV